VTTAIMGNAAIAALSQKQHLIVPGIRAQGPPVAEDHGLSYTPILVINLGAVFGRNDRHRVTPDEVMNLKNLDLKNLDLKNLDLKNLDLKNLDLKNLDLKNLDLKNRAKGSRD
jgi:hypothetical protein